MPANENLKRKRDTTPENSSPTTQTENTQLTQLNPRQREQLFQTDQNPSQARMSRDVQQNINISQDTINKTITELNRNLSFLGVQRGIQQERVKLYPFPARGIAAEYNELLTRSEEKGTLLSEQRVNRMLQLTENSMDTKEEFNQL